MPAAIDYCTLAPDAIGAIVISACCQAHDAAYDVVRTLAEKLTADAALGQCIARFDGWQMDVVGIVYFVAAATVGTLFWLRVRWQRCRNTHPA